MMRRLFQRARRLGAGFIGDRRGVAAVEFALISPTVIRSVGSTVVTRWTRRPHRRTPWWR